MVLNFSLGYPRLILLCCESAWTLIFTTAYMMWVVDGGAQILANVASSVIWLLLTAVLWVRDSLPQQCRMMGNKRHFVLT